MASDILPSSSLCVCLRVSGSLRFRVWGLGTLNPKAPKP